MNAARKHFSVAVAVAVCLGIGHGALADVTFTVGGGSSVSGYPYMGHPPWPSGSTQNGMGIDWAMLVPPTPASFTLAQGDSHTFDFFSIWTPENDININDGNDQIPREFTAILDLQPPETPDPMFEGDTYASVEGGVVHGVLDWDNPPVVTVTTADYTYTVTLSPDPATFDWGTGLDSNGRGYFGNSPATIQATVTLEDENVIVPEPATMGLLGFGAVLVLVRRRRRP